VHDLLPGRDGLLGIAPWLVALGVVFMNTLTLVVIGMVSGLAPIAAAVGGEDVVVAPLALTLVHFEDHGKVLATVLLWAGTLMIGWRILRSSVLPRWLGWTGAIAGAAGVFSGLRLVADPFSTLVLVAQILLLLGFIVPASLVLIGRTDALVKDHKPATSRDRELAVP
jgi:hypothetical protein